MDDPTTKGGVSSERRRKPRRDVRRRVEGVQHPGVVMGIDEALGQISDQLSAIEDAMHSSNRRGGRIGQVLGGVLGAIGVVLVVAGAYGVYILFERAPWEEWKPVTVTILSSSCTGSPRNAEVKYVGELSLAVERPTSLEGHAIDCIAPTTYTGQMKADRLQIFAEEGAVPKIIEFKMKDRIFLEPAGTARKSVGELGSETQ